MPTVFEKFTIVVNKSALHHRQKSTRWEINNIGKKKIFKQRKYSIFGSIYRYSFRERIQTTFKANLEVYVDPSLSNSSQTDRSDFPLNRVRENTG